MSRAKTIHVEKLTVAAADAAKKVLGDRATEIGNPAIGFIPDIGTMGLIWRDPDLKMINAAELVEISEMLAKEISPLVGDVKPYATIFKGGATAGYFPVDPIITREML